MDDYFCLEIEYYTNTVAISAINGELLDEYSTDNTKEAQKVYDYYIDWANSSANEFDIVCIVWYYRDNEYDEIEKIKESYWVL